jgi:hypothetical protein
MAVTLRCNCYLHTIQAQRASRSTLSILVGTAILVRAPDEVPRCLKHLHAKFVTNITALIETLQVRRQPKPARPDAFDPQLTQRCQPEARAKSSEVLSASSRLIQKIDLGLPALARPPKPATPHMRGSTTVCTSAVAIPASMALRLSLECRFPPPRPRAAALRPYPYPSAEIGPRIPRSDHTGSISTSVNRARRPVIGPRQH